MSDGDNIEWRVIDFAPNYEISEYGCVRRRITNKQYKAGAVLRQMSCARGYRYVTLCQNGVSKNQRINRLVCHAFHGPAPFPEAQAAHNDGSKANNHYTNLRWATPLENTLDKHRHGTMARARAKLGWADVREIRSIERPCYSALGRKYGVSHNAIRNAWLGITWRSEGVGQ